MSTAVLAASSTVSAPVPVAQAGHSDGSDFTFDDLVSIINPLQHIPIVSTIYRSMTGDTIKPMERILGDTLYGGVWGGVSAVANVIYQDATGKDFGQTVLDLVTGNDDDAQSTAASAVQSPTMDAAPTMASSGPGAATADAASLSTAMPSVANGPPRALQPPTTATSTTDTATLALMHALSEKGVDPSVSQRAVSAYKKSLQTKPANSNPAPAQIPTS